MEYINQVKTTIEGVKDEYQDDKSVNVSLLWKMIKLSKSYRTNSEICEKQKGKNVARRRTGEEN